MKFAIDMSNGETWNINAESVLCHMAIHFVRADGVSLESPEYFSRVQRLIEEYRENEFLVFDHIETLLSVEQIRNLVYRIDVASFPQEDLSIEGYEVL